MKGDTDLIIAYSKTCSQWQLKSVSDRKNSLCWAYIHCLKPLPIDVISCPNWISIYDNFSSQLQILTTVQTVESMNVYIYGVSGPNSHFINGEYETSTEIYNGATRFYKKGVPWITIEYFTGLKRQFQVKLSTAQMIDRCWAYKPSDITSLTHCTDVYDWRVGDGIQFNTQPHMRLLVPAKHRIRIYCESNLHNEHIIGDYVPTKEIINGASVYRKVESSDTNNHTYSIQYHNDFKQWQIVKDDEVILAYLSMLKSIPLDLYEGDPGVWYCYDDEGNVSESTLWSIVPAVYPVLVTGVSGGNAEVIEGMFEPTNNIINHASVYGKRDDHAISIFYVRHLRSWQITHTDSDGAETPLACLYSPAALPIEFVCKQNIWKINVNDDDDIFEEQKSVSVIIPATEPILISGATGINAVNINGVYKPSNEILNNGTVYVKHGCDQICIAYYSGSHSEWQVKEVSMKNSDCCYAYLSYPYPLPIDLIINNKETLVSSVEFSSQKRTWQVSSDWTEHRSPKEYRIESPLTHKSDSTATSKSAFQADAATLYQRFTSFFFLPVSLPYRYYTSLKSFDIMKFVEQSSVRVQIPPKNFLVFSNATGPHASEIKGLYVPTYEVADGVCVYVKRDRKSMFLEYCLLLQQWQLKPIELKGSTKCWAFLVCASPMNADSIDHTQWQWQAESNAEFNVRLEVQILPFVSLPQHSAYVLHSPVTSGGFVAINSSSTSLPSSPDTTIVMKPVESSLTSSLEDRQMQRPERENNHLIYVLRGLGLDIISTYENKTVATPASHSSHPHNSAIDSTTSTNADEVGYFREENPSSRPASPTCVESYTYLTSSVSEIAVSQKRHPPKLVRDTSDLEALGDISALTSALDDEEMDENTDDRSIILPSDKHDLDMMSISASRNGTKALN